MVVVVVLVVVLVVVVVVAVVVAVAVVRAVANTLSKCGSMRVVRPLGRTVAPYLNRQRTN